MQDKESYAAIVKDLSLFFKEHCIYEGINLQIPKRGLTVVVGPSGSGKTCLLRALNRLNECYSDCTVSGEVKLFLESRWYDIYNEKVCLPHLRRQVQMVFQSPNVLPTTIEKNITLPLKMAGGVLKDSVEEALSAVGLFDEVKDRLKKPAHTLSGGQQGRLCLARALALKPQILLVDEPTANLDPEKTEEIEQLLMRLKKKMTVVAVTHDRSQADRMADKMFKM